MTNSDCPWELREPPGPTAAMPACAALPCDLIEEYGRHTGHGGLLREAAGGLTGEDPPPGWHPVTGPAPWA